MKLSSKDLVHYGVEAIAVTGVVVYFVYENNKLKKEIAELRQETRDIAKYVKIMETKFGTALNQVMSAHPPSIPGPVSSSSNPSPRPAHKHKHVRMDPRTRPPPRRKPAEPIYNDDIEQEEEEEEYNSISEEEENPQRQPVRQPRRRKMRSANSDIDPSEVKINSTRRSNQPKVHVSARRPSRPTKPVARVEVIEDEDLLGDIEAVASKPSMRSKSHEGRPESGSKIKDRMNRTKQIAEAMRMKREAKLKAEGAEID